MSDFKYATLENLVDSNVVEALTNTLFALHEDGKSSNSVLQDAHVPGSDSFYFNETCTNPLVMEVQAKIKERAELILGKSLFPTYVFARIYRKGSELSKHYDRVETEYSVTLTLGSSDKNVWPIHFKHRDAEDIKSVDMLEGDAVLYKGQELEHWREPLSDDYHCQMFFHYVDDNGPYKQHAQAEKYKTPEISNEVYAWCFQGAEGILDSVCDLYVNQLKDLPLEDATVGFDGSGKVNDEVRKVKKRSLSCFSGVSSYLVSAAQNANMQIWKYDLDACSQSEYLQYAVDNKYDTHADYTFLTNRRELNVRKLTAISVLNDEFEGGQFYIIQEDGTPWYPPQGKGDVIVFPSYLLHGVTPVTSGTRHAVVAWINGPDFK